MPGSVALELDIEVCELGDRQLQHELVGCVIQDVSGEMCMLILPC